VCLNLVMKASQDFLICVFASMTFATHEGQDLIATVEDCLSLKVMRPTFNRPGFGSG